MIKMISLKLDDELHQKIKAKLKDDGETFNGWIRRQVIKYLRENKS
jgi:hypothetical protein